MLIDHRGALFAADVRFDQLALDGGGRQALIPKRDRQVGELAKVARESSRRLRAVSLLLIDLFIVPFELWWEGIRGFVTPPPRPPASPPPSSARSPASPRWRLALTGT